MFVLLVDNVGEDASVVALDRDAGTELRTYPTGHDPAAAVSLGGDRLYVASGVDLMSYLSVIDTATGRVLQQVSFANRWRNTLPAYFPVMAVSPDGRWLYGLKVQSQGPEADVYSVAVFDTRAGSFLSAELAVPGCVGGLLVPLQARLDVACPFSGTLFSAPVARDGGLGLPSSTKASDSGFVGAARLANTADVLVLTKANKIMRIGSGGVNPILVLAMDGSEDPVFGAFAVSPDGSRAFVGLGGPSSEQISTVQAYDLATGRRIASVSLPEDAWAISLAADGESLYAPSQSGKMIYVLETDRLSLIDKIPVKAPPTLIVSR